MTPFEHHIEVVPADIDEMGHVNNVVYLRWIQEVSAAHWLQISSEQLRSSHLWVVLRHEIDYKNPAFIHDQITGFTWVGDHSGARFERYVKLVNASGKILAESKTTWCLLDAKTLRPQRIPSEILDIL